MTRSPGRTIRSALHLVACALVADCTSAPAADGEAAGALPATSEAPAPETPDLVSITDIDPTIVVEARYFGGHNFVGEPIDGYEAPKCLLSRPAAEALARVQADLRPFGIGLKTYDCYRPARAVAHFARWARDTADTRMRAAFYPTIDKSRLFELGYIAERSGHSRASTVDLTLIPLPPPPQPAFDPAAALVSCTAPAGERFADSSLDMGTGYDCFSERSHTENPAVGPVAARNRLLLKAVMEKHGFVNYAQEWWHFTLADEPYPQTYFDLPVR